MHCRPCLRRFVARVPLLLSLATLALPLQSAHARRRSAPPAISNPAPFGNANGSSDLALGEMPIGGPVIKSNAAQTPSPDWTGAAPPPGTPDIPGVTYSNASDTKNADSSQPPPALGPTSVPLDSIRSLQVGTQPLPNAPMRVGNLDILAPLVDTMPLLVGAKVTRADLRLVPGDPNSPIENSYFQINRIGQPPIVLCIGQARAWINKNEQTLRAAPLVVGGQIYMPVFSLAPLLGAAARLNDSGTLVLTPTVESVQVFPVSGTIAVTVKTSKPLPSGLKFNSIKGNDGKTRLYVDFPGYSMGFDALSTTNERVVASGNGDILRARAGMPSKFPDVTRITLDLKRPLSGIVQPTSDPTIFAFVVSPDVVLRNYSPGSEPLRGLTIVLDAGHGGHDSGALGARSREKDHALDMVLRLASALRAQGANVELTRGGDYFVTLQGRVDFANERNANLFISIHNNASESRSSSGTETFFYTSQSQSFAREIHKELSKATGCPNRGISQARFFVVRKTWMPSVLLELAFITNPREEGYLSSDQWSQRVAEGVARGVLNYNAVYLKGGLNG